MTTAPIKQIFLSHTGIDKRFVTAVADGLARRGVVPWLDIHDLYPGVNLRCAIENVIEDPKTAVAVFLSDAANKSGWVRDELQAAVDVENLATSRGLPSPVIPVFLGRPLDLVQGNQVVRPHWLSADQTRVERLGITGNPGNSEEVATKLADAVLRHGAARTAREVAWHIDQRGTGRRTGLDGLDIPPAVCREAKVAFVIRPDLGARGEKQLCDMDVWPRVCDGLEFVRSFLGPGGAERRVVHLSGRAQASLFWTAGRQLDYSAGVEVVAHDFRGRTTTALKPSDAIPGGDDGAPLELVTEYDPPAAEPSLSLAIISPRQEILRAVRSHHESRANRDRLMVGRHDMLEASQVLPFLKSVRAAMSRLDRVPRYNIYTTLPVHVVALLACMCGHLLPREVVFWEVSETGQYHPFMCT